MKRNGKFTLPELPRFYQNKRKSNFFRIKDSLFTRIYGDNMLILSVIFLTVKIK